MKRTKQLGLLAFVAILTLTSCQQAEERREERPVVTKLGMEAARAEVRHMLEAQSACWSQGDLDCFMQDYWKSDSLLFVGKSGLTYGWQQTLDNYRKSYPDRSAMGKLTFDLKEMRPLSTKTMLVVGKWHLQREASLGDLQGHFSIILKHFPEGWKIIADHSS
jgi:ketosteroid isomerase-like protein